MRGGGEWREGKSEWQMADSLMAIASGDRRGWSFLEIQNVLVFYLVKHEETSDTTVQDVIGEVSCSEAWTAWYGGVSSESVAILPRERFPTLFLVP